MEGARRKGKRGRKGTRELRLEIPKGNAQRKDGFARKVGSRRTGSEESVFREKQK